MILGIDVGSTHTDGALMNGSQLISKAKTPTVRHRLFTSLKQITSDLLGRAEVNRLKRVVLSTTICTNAVVENKMARVGTILVNGPGLAPGYVTLNRDTYFLSGYINHRGLEVAPMSEKEVKNIIDTFAREDIFYSACVGKFSTRNPLHELNLKKWLSGLRHVSLGHKMSGQLNFPRRVATAYLNAAVWEIYRDFAGQVTDFFQGRNINVPIFILKADGGTFALDLSTDLPGQTILSGPAASIMGMLAATQGNKDAIALDIGGTTSDIAIFTQGLPLFMPSGVIIAGFKTSIRGLRTRSIGIGGDSKVVYHDGTLKIGPNREGPAAALGGAYPTPTDAMIILGLTKIGRHDLAAQALEPLALALNLSLEDLAQAILSHSCQLITQEIKKELDEINNQPVYTVNEYLGGRKLKPEILYVVGGPAEALAPRLGALLDCPFVVPPHADVANAIGAALARTTCELTMLADTEQGTMSIAEEGWQARLDRNFNINVARQLITDRLRAKAITLGAREEDLETEIIEENSYPVVRNSYRAGENIRIKAQIKPGLLASVGERIEL